MRKTLFIACVLLVAVISTACINSFAVQDLNNKAQALMTTGETQQAIEKLKSSIDLDPNIFETHYNLAVAYTEIEDYINAIEEFKKAIKLKPDSADVYSALATAEHNLSFDMRYGKVRIDEQGKLYVAQEGELDYDNKYDMSDEEKDFVKEVENSAILNYEKYLELNPNADDKVEIENIIERIKENYEPSED